MRKINWHWRFLDGLLLGGILLLIVYLCVEPFREEEGWGFAERILFKSKSTRKSTSISARVLQRDQIPPFLNNYPQVDKSEIHEVEKSSKDISYLVVSAFNQKDWTSGTYFYTLQGERPFGEFMLDPMRPNERIIQLIRPIYGTEAPKVSPKNKSFWIYSFRDPK